MKELESLVAIKKLEKIIEDDLNSLEILVNCNSISDRTFWDMIRDRNRLQALKKFLDTDFSDKPPIWKLAGFASSHQGVF